VFEWLSNILTTCAKVLPHLVHVKCTHAGVMFRGSKYRVLKPGLHVYFPFYSEPIVIPVERQAVDLQPQTLTCVDSVTVEVAATVVYRIENVEKALTATWDHDGTVAEVAQRSVKNCVTRLSSEKVLYGAKGFDALLRKRLVRELIPYGVDVKQAFLTTAVPVKTFRVFTGKAL
jgi:regulator of protease activity HflC (stomatin/prohibitin superfamily)